MLTERFRDTIAVIVLSILFSGSLHAKQNFTIAVLLDHQSEYTTDIQQEYISELNVLVENEFDLAYLEYKVDWSEDDFNQQVDAIYSNPQVDMLLVLGLAANQLIVKRDSFQKPTFLPFIVERELVQAPYKEGVSAKKNLSYLTYSTQFLGSLDILREVVPFTRIAVLADELLLNALPQQVVASAGSQANQTLLLVRHDGVDNNLIDRIPSDVDAVMFGHLPRLSSDQIKNLIDELTNRKIPTFSYLEEGLIEKGLLATPLNESVYQFSARRNALNMQAVMLGEKASNQPVVVETKSKLTINQITAQRLGVAVDFKVLVDADVIGFGVGYENERYSLLDITRLVIDNNLQLKDEKFNLDIQASERAIAKGRLLPQLSADASLLRRKDDSSLVLSGFASEQTTDVAVNLSQTLFSDSEWANYKIQSLLYAANTEQYRQTRLDVIRESSLAMADVLQAQSVAAIQQENLSFSEKNLELAIDRVNIGAASAADQFRWETQVANAKSAVFDAFSSVLIAKQNLNRILNRGITDELELAPLDVNSFLVYSIKEMFELMDNTSSFEQVYRFGLKQAYQSSPEIKQFESLIQAKQRQIKTLKRQNWLPAFSLTGQFSENIDRSGLQANDADGRDWQLMLNARVPFYQGGQISAERERNELELAQLENQLESVQQQIAQRLRSSMNTLLTSLFNLEFSKSAAAAAARSLSLVTDSYAKGVVPVVDLFDSQNASVSANLAEVQASIGFFRAHIEMQRTIGVYEFLMSEQQKNELRNRLAATLNSE